MSFHCPTCNKIAKSPIDLVRHMFGRGDKVHRDWINSKGFKYSEMLAAQVKSFGDEEYKRLAAVLEKDPKINVKDDK
jgi:hypothetical protein